MTTTFCALMAILAVVSAEGSLRGSDVSDIKRSPFFDSSCEIGWTTADSCSDVVDAEGNPCVWCELPVFGLCVDSKQASILTAYFDCGGSDDDDAYAVDDDAMTFDDDDDDKIELSQDGVDISTTCLRAGVDAKSCGASVDDDGVTCIWCEAHNHDFALCLTSGQADYASKILDCQIGGRVLAEEEGPEEEEEALADISHDFSCAKSSGDIDVCRSTKDSMGAACSFCYVWDNYQWAYGVCVNDEQASHLGRFLECTSGHDKEKVVAVIKDDPFDFTCAKGTEEASCTSADDADGDACVWCDYQDMFGICVNDAQATYIKKYLECGGDFASLPDEDVIKENPLDFTCEKSGTDEDSCGSAVDSSGDACVWCDYQGMAGLCVDDAQSSILEKYLDCGDRELNEGLKEDPLDFSCEKAATDEDSCGSAVDSDGDACVWCDYQGMVGLCVNDAQASLIDKYLDCGDQELEEDFQEDPLDFSCEKAGTDEDSCGSAVDADGDACVWCDYQGMVGLCVNDAQASLIDKYLDCGKREEKEDLEEDPLDFSCEKGATDEDSCGSAVDADGDACVWCDYQGMVGLCVDDAQASILEKYLDCGKREEKEDLEEDPLDFSCEKAATDEDSCGAAVDADGEACIWCDYQGMAGMCVDDAQASILEKYLDCGKREKEDLEEDPLDFSCEKAATDEDSCGSAVDANGDACVWCDYQGMVGLCVDDAQASLIDKYLDCGDRLKEEDWTENPLDFSCEKAGADEDSCGSAVDADGDACVWCDYQGMAGVCVDDAQASILAKYFDCGDGDDQSLEKIDTTCMAASRSEESCVATSDSNGEGCVWCTAFENYSLCVSAEQAKDVNKFASCSTSHFVSSKEE